MDGIEQGAYAKHGGREHIGTDAQGRDVWRLRGRIDGVSFSERFHGTKTDAGRKLTDLRKQARDGTLPAAGSESVAALVERYISHQIGLNKLRRGQPANTYRGYFRNHVSDKVKAMQFRATRPKDLQAILNAMMAKGRAASTVRQLGALLHGSFDLALHQGDIAINPMDGVTLPKAHRANITPPDPTTTSRILQAADEEYRVALAISAATGLRRGEVCALRWGDLRVNEQGDYVSLHVAGTLQRVDGTLERMRPKTDRGYRDVPLPPSLSVMLRRARKEQAERRLLLGEAWGDGDALVDRGDGRPIDPDTFSKAFRTACKRAKVSGVRLHDLRHAFGTMQEAAGVSVAVYSQALGHSSTSFTMNTYVHPTDEMAAPLANTAEAVLGEALGKLH